MQWFFHNEREVKRNSETRAIEPYEKDSWMLFRRLHSDDEPLKKNLRDITFLVYAVACKAIILC